MKTSTGRKIVVGVIAFMCFWFYADYQSKKPTPLSQEEIKQIERETAAYDSLKRDTSGGFIYMYNSVFNHRDASNNISAYIKHNIATQKSFLFMKASCKTLATQTYAVFLRTDNDFIDIDYINDVYPLKIVTTSKDIYGVLDIQIGDILTDFLDKISKSTNAYVKFVDIYGGKEFPVSQKEKDAIEQVLLGYQHIKRKALLN
jgi:hypothetical protein